MSTTMPGTSTPGTSPTVVWRLTEPLFQRGARLLAHAARERYGPISAVVGIANGGRALAYAIGAGLNVRAFIVSPQRSQPPEMVYPQGGSTVTVDVGEVARQVAVDSLHGRVLIVDDVSSGAATLDAVCSALDPFLADDVTLVTAVLCRRAGSRTDPDLWLWTVRDTVIFPWDGGRGGRQSGPVLPDITGVHPRLPGDYA
jgi:adenine/guanine phosphoribosyltransferase-like PRPP-binding protein